MMISALVQPGIESYQLLVVSRTCSCSLQCALRPHPIFFRFCLEQSPKDLKGLLNDIEVMMRSSQELDNTSNQT